MLPDQHIFLLGLPGSGKSTLGLELAQKLQRTFIDTDLLIEEQQQLSISQIFEEYGESAFRQLESQLLDKLPQEASIIATGGGLPCFNDNMSTINAIGTSIYLEVPEEVLVNRLIDQTAARPLLQNQTEAELMQTLRRHLEKRKPYYRRATLVVSGVDITSELILSALQSG